MVKIMYSLFFLGLVSLSNLGYAQESLPERNAQEPLEQQLATLLTQNPSLVFENQLWCYLHFQEVPSENQKASLSAAGISLYQYQPNLKWFASMQTDINASILISASVDRVFTKPIFRKMDQRIFRDEIPSHATEAHGVKANIVVAAESDLSSMVTTLVEMGIQINDRLDPLGILNVSGSRQALLAAARMPFVVYVELPAPPAELEIEDEMTMTRAPYINGYYNLNGLNGDGVKIAVNEGGIINPAYHPDFKNRLDLSEEGGTISGHKTGVSWRMASAGNINPIHRGQAWGAEQMSGGINFSNAADSNINIVNNSFGYGCIPSGPTYNSGAATNDFLVRTHNRFMITYSCGNIGGSNCQNYGAGPGWGNITGLVKSAKNIFAVGAMNTNDQLTGFSSRGPAMDGRILPDITASGPGGTSHASPNLAGVNAILTQAYREENASQWPNSGLIKGIILNTADDIENEGPDFKTGFGRINASRALNVIENDQLITDNIANSVVDLNAIVVPSGVSQLKVSIYWNDREATPGIFGKTLVNDLDLRVQDPNSNWVKPWVLSSFPDPDSLNALAVQGTDTLNNVEMVTIDNPPSGTYNIEVTGTMVPFGPQEYFVIYSFVYDSIKVIYPRGGEGLVPGEARRIRWDAYDSGNTFDIDFSSDSGATWSNLATGLASNSRSYTWTIPPTLSGNCLVKIKDGANDGLSDSQFTIVDPPSNLSLVWRCADSAIFAWDSVPGAMGYRAYKLGNKYMDTLSYTSNTYVKVYNLSPTETEWVSVQAVLPDSGSGRRAIAMAIQPGDFNCIGQDLAVTSINRPEAGYYPSCSIGDTLPLEIKLQNTGTTSLAYQPIAYQLIGGAIAHDTIFSALSSAAQSVLIIPSAIVLQAGINELKVWSTFPGDGNAANDTMEITINVYGGISATIPYSQSFDNFTNCSTAWGCETIDCNLSAGWFNLPNNNNVDTIDWRTHSGSTGSGGTGPTGDHTSGNGKYLYLEGSGNGGSGCQNHEAQVNSPCFDLTGTNSPTISYWYHAFGGGIGSLHLDVLSEGQWHLDVGPPVIGAQGNQWFQEVVDLSAFEGQEAVLRFRGRTGGSWLSDLAIDDINLTTFPLAGFETEHDTFCLGQTVPLVNTTTYGLSYSWSIVPSSFIYVVGNNTSTNPSILPNDTGWYDVQLIATNASGSDTLLVPNLFYVGDFDAPTLISNAIGDVYCFGDSASFTANGTGSGYNFYQNNTLVQSGNSNNWGTIVSTTGDLVWVVNNINTTCGLISDTIEVQMQPDINGTPLWSDDVDQIICEGDTVQFSTEKDYDQYVFNINGAPVQSGADSLFASNQLTDGDNVFVSITDTVGCMGFSDTLSWTVYPIPQTPSILSVGIDSLEASVIANSYLWWNNLVLLTDTTQMIVAMASGIYHVQVMDFGCISDLSSEYQHTLFGNDELGSDAIRIYPNPASQEIHVMLENGRYSQVTLFDKTGRRVLTQTMSLGINTLEIAMLPAGIYTIQVLGLAGSKAFMIVVV